MEPSTEGAIIVSGSMKCITSEHARSCIRMRGLRHLWVAPASSLWGHYPLHAPWTPEPGWTQPEAWRVAAKELVTLVLSGLYQNCGA